MEKKLDFTESAKKQIIKITQSENEKKWSLDIQMMIKCYRKER